MKAGKVWGTTWALLQTPLIELHEIEVRQGGRCSKHKHAHKHNAFYVLEGSLRISVFKNNYDLVDVTTLEAGEFMVVSPGEYHFFEAKSDTKALELYFPEVLSADIIRENVGGLVKVENEYKTKVTVAPPKPYQRPENLVTFTETPA